MGAGKVRKNQTMLLGVWPKRYFSYQGISMQKVWKVTPGRQAMLWRDCFDNKCIAVDCLNKLDLAQLNLEQDFGRILAEHEKDGANNAQSLYDFVHQMRVGDLIIANDGRRKCRGIGVVKSDYLHPGHRQNPFRNNDDNAQVRLVDWEIDQTIELPTDFFNDAIVQLLADELVMQVKRAYLEQTPKLTQKVISLLPLNIAVDEGKIKPESEAFVPDEADERESIMQQVMIRRGQQAFRQALINRYQGKCLVTGCQILDILEAAHINPYRGTKDNHEANGLLLRSDIHTLFDLGKLAIEPQTLSVHLSADVAVDAHYAAYHGRKLLSPCDASPSLEALTLRHRWFSSQNA